MIILTTIGEGDADMYVAYEREPTLIDFDWSSASSSSDVL